MSKEPAEQFQYSVEEIGAWCRANGWQTALGFAWLDGNNDLQATRRKEPPPKHAKKTIRVVFYRAGADWKLAHVRLARVALRGAAETVKEPDSERDNFSRGLRLEHEKRSKNLEVVRERIAIHERIREEHPEAWTKQYEDALAHAKGTEEILARTIVIFDKFQQNRGSLASALGSAFDGSSAGSVSPHWRRLMFFQILHRELVPLLRSCYQLGGAVIDADAVMQNADLMRMGAQVGRGKQATWKVKLAIEWVRRSAAHPAKASKSHVTEVSRFATWLNGRICPASGRKIMVDRKNGMIDWTLGRPAKVKSLGMLLVRAKKFHF